MSEDTLPICVPGRNGGTLTPFKAGDDPRRNIAGGRTAGATVADWYNQMAGWSEDEIEDAYTHPRSTAAKKAAAGQWLESIAKALASLKEVCDRTDGQSIARTQVEQNVTLRTADERSAAGDRIASRIRALVHPGRN